jgi:hypothetical protein
LVVMFGAFLVGDRVPVRPTRARREGSETRRRRAIRADFSSLVAFAPAAYTINVGAMCCNEISAFGDGPETGSDAGAARSAMRGGNDLPQRSRRRAQKRRTRQYSYRFAARKWRKS